MAKPTYQDLIERAALTALELFKATTTKKALKVELSVMYDKFFQENGRPEGSFDQHNEAFLPVMNFTSEQYRRVDDAKRAEYNAKRRHETAIRALAGFQLRAE